MNEKRDQMQNSEQSLELLRDLAENMIFRLGDVRRDLAAIRDDVESLEGIPDYFMETLYENMTAPCFLYTGEVEERQMLTEDFAKDLPQASFIALPGLNHDQAILQIDKILPHVQEFLKEVSMNFESAKG